MTGFPESLLRMTLGIPREGDRVTFRKGPLTLQLESHRGGLCVITPNPDDSGAGQVAKTVNQVIVGMTIGAVAEALTLARRAGVDPAKVRDAIRGGFAESRILELHAGRMVASSFEPGGRATVQRKDVVQALELAAGLGLVLPGLERNRTLWERMIEKGWGDLDHSALIKVIEES